jgi:hypothetical protein
LREQTVPVESLGDAWNLSWEIHVRCLYDGREGMKHRQECGYRKYLDLETLVSTRGRDFPIARIAERLRCPRCGCRNISVMFNPPGRPQIDAVASARLERDERFDARPTSNTKGA